MISKCQNVVINRTKFSDFEDFEVGGESTENLNLVGYVETTDALGNTVSKNVSVKYPADMGPRLENIENIIGVQAFENIDSSTCDHTVDCCIACKFAEIDENLESNLENFNALQDEFAEVKQAVADARSTVFTPQENILFVHTSLKDGSAELSVAEIMSQYDNEVNSAAWSMVIVTAVKAGNKMIYPEIIYTGDVDKNNYDKRKITIIHEVEVESTPEGEPANTNQDITVVINALKHSSKGIISL